MILAALEQDVEDHLCRARVADRRDPASGKSSTFEALTWERPRGALRREEADDLRGVRGRAHGAPAARVR
jgi:hypothetical protein